MSKNTKNKTANGFTIHSGTGKNGIPYSGIYGTALATSLGRIAFVNLAAPSGVGDQAKYSVAHLTPKDSPENEKNMLRAIQTICKLMMVDFWGDKAGDLFKRIKRPILVDGDEPSSTGKIYDGYPGNWIINAKNKFPAGHTQGFKILNPNMLPEQFESGMICRLVVTPYLNADGFSYGLNDIKFISAKDDGVRFSGVPDSSGLIDHLDEAVAAVNSNATNLNFEGVI